MFTIISTEFSPFSHADKNIHLEFMQDEEELNFKMILHDVSEMLDSNENFITT